MGGVMSGVGAQIGSVVGMAGGGWAAYSSQMAKAATGLASKEVAKTASKEATKEVASTGEKELYNLGKTATQHMTESGRRVPLQIIDDVLKTTKGLPDPGGSRALMHYSQMWKNGKLYNLEILYNQPTNSIWHFKYTQEALGPLSHEK
jgi:hypothetical protein